MIRAIGNSGARSAGPIGWPVAGCSGGGSGAGRSAWMLYQAVGIRSSGSRYFTVSIDPPSPCEQAMVHMDNHINRPDCQAIVVVLHRLIKYSKRNPLQFRVMIG